MSQDTIGRLTRLSEQEQRALLAKLLHKKTAKTRTAPLSFAQQRLWFVDQLEPGNAAYNMFHAIRLHGTLDVTALERGFNQVLQRHESLRTTFATKEGEPYQVIALSRRETLPVIDLSTLSEAQQDTEVQHQVCEEVQRPFDLARGPLVRCTLLRLTHDEHVLLLVMHHIVSDGWSMGILFREIILLTQAYAAGKENPLPALPLQYADFAIWQRKWLQGEVLEAQVSYWKKQLAGAPNVLELPTDYPRPAVQTYHGAQLKVALTRELMDNLQMLSRQEDVTLFMTLLAAFQVLLSRYSGQTDIVVGSPVANRNRDDLEMLIGFFANNLVLRTDLSGTPNIHEVLQRVRDTCMGAYDHQDMPFEKMVNELQVKRDLSHNPLFQVMFILQNTPMDVSDLSGLSYERLDAETDTAQFDLRLSLLETPTGLTGTLQYNTDLFERETITLLFESYRHILEGWVNNPDQSLSEIRLPEALSVRVEAAKARERKQTLAIAATFTVEPVEESLAFWMQELGLPSEIRFAPYNQVFQQLLDPSSQFSQSEYGVNIILLRFEDWLRDAQSADPVELLDRNLADLEKALLSATPRFKIPCQILVCPPSPSELTRDGRAEHYLAMEEHLREALTNSSNLHLIPSAELAIYYPVKDYYNSHTDELGHLPFTSAMYAAIGSLLARHVHAWRNASYKVIVLDCDNTLWRGICGETDPRGVDVSAPYQTLQKFMLDQLNAGMLLCLCSKNEETDVWTVFDTHPAMLLKREHLVSWRINWKPKSENIQSLAAELGLGLDSFIFIDDNPVECAEVDANCPAVLTLQLPQEIDYIPHFLQHVWAFDHFRLTEEDRKRTHLYQQNIAREQVRSQALTFKDFLAELALQMQITELTSSELERAAQLTQRTNQFNFTTLRRTESELQNLCLGGEKTCLCVRVTDRFGDYGLVGIVIFGQNATTIQVDTFLLSCRVLGRGVEHRMLSHLAELAKADGFEWLEVPYIPTAKNRPAFDFLQTGEQFRQAAGESYLFKFPVEWAMGAVERVHHVKPVRENERSAQPAVKISQTKSTEIIRIAHDLADVGRIVQASRKQERCRTKQAVEYTAPRTAQETTLAEIWKEILRLEQVGIHDDFFSLGGDSLLSLQLLAQMQKRAQLHITPRQFMQHSTIALLANIATSNNASNAEQGIVTGPVHLTPNPHWFLERNLPHPEQWIISLEMETLLPLTPDLLRKVVQTLFSYHDILRSRFVRKENIWQQFIVEPSNDIPLHIIDLSELPEEEQNAAIQTASERLKTSMSLLDGPLAQIVYFDLGPQRPGRLSLAIHHIISDAYSLQILAADFHTAYKQIMQGDAINLGGKTTSYQEWAKRLRGYASSDEMRQEVNYWIDLPWERTVCVPLDAPNDTGNTIASTRTLRASLNKAETSLLLKAYPTGLVDVLLTAFGQTLAHLTRSSCIYFLLIINGRKDIFEHVDLSRTVGLFAIGHPVILDMTDAQTPEQALSTTQRQLAQIPNSGITHGVIKFIEDENLKNKLRDRADKVIESNKIIFNYIPPMGEYSSGDVLFRPIQGTADLSEDPQNKRDYILKCTANISEGQLIFNWEYSVNLHRPDTIAAIAQFYLDALRALSHENRFHR